MSISSILNSEPVPAGEMTPRDKALASLAAEVQDPLPDPTSDPDDDSVDEVPGIMTQLLTDALNVQRRSRLATQRRTSVSKPSYLRVQISIGNHPDSYLGANASDEVKLDCGDFSAERLEAARAETDRKLVAAWNYVANRDQKAE